MAKTCTSPHIRGKVKNSNMTTGKQDHRKGRRITVSVALAEPQLEDSAKRLVPWANIGHVLDNPNITAEEAIKLSGLDFNVSLHPAGWTENGGKSWKRAPGRVAIVRDDTGEQIAEVSDQAVAEAKAKDNGNTNGQRFFNFASTDYTPVQYREAFTFLDAINPNFVAAGPIRNGRQGFVVVQFPDLSALDLEFKSGQHDPFGFYAVLRTSQDLSRGVEISVAALRGPCTNILTLPSLVRGAKQRWAIRHSKNVVARMHEAQKTLQRTGDYIEEFKRTAHRLAEVSVTEENARHTLERVLPDRPRRSSQIDEIMTTYQESPFNGYVGTGWGLVNGVNEYFLWTRNGATKNPTAQFTNALEGSTHKIVSKTAQVLLSGAARH